MKIGYAQWNPLLGDLEANRARMERLAAQAAGADLLVFPELSNSGYHFKSREEAWAASEPIPGGDTVRLLCELSARHGMFLVSGICERDGERLYNSAVAVGPEGLIGRYRKTHLFLNEKDLFSPGDLGFPVFELDLKRLRAMRGTSGEDAVRDPASALRPPGSEAEETPCRIGILICFDWQFPEVWRVLALKGAEVVCHPSNLVLPGRAQRAVPVHSMLNRVFTVLSNRIGSERGLEFTGESIIVAPSGDVLASAPEHEEEVRVIEIDLAEARNKMVTSRNDLIADRRPEFYGEITRPRAEPRS
jgi:predicted amidohydrolase